MDWKARIAAAFGPVSPDPDIIEELAQHAEAMYAAARADGASEADAIAQVDQQIAGWVKAPDVLRRPRPPRPPITNPPASLSSGVLSVAHDVRYALRLLRGQPGYASVVIATIALGIAATTVLASVAYGVLLKPLPWADAPRLVRLYESRQGSTGRLRPMMTNATYRAWRDAPATLDAIGGWTTSHVTLEDPVQPRRITVAYVTASLLPMAT